MLTIFVISSLTLIKAFQNLWLFKRISTDISLSLGTLKCFWNSNVTLCNSLSCANSLTYRTALPLTGYLCIDDSDWPGLLFKPFIVLLLIHFPLLTVTIISKSWLTASPLRANIFHYKTCKLIKLQRWAAQRSQRTCSFVAHPRPCLTECLNSIRSLLK